MYDTFPYIRRAGYNEPQQTSKGNIRECNERIGERPEGSEAMHGRGDAEFASAKTICRIRQFNYSIGVAIKNLYFVGTREQVFIYLLFCVSELRNL